MKKLMSLIVIVLALFIGITSPSVFADTIFTGMSSSGIMRLTEDFRIGAYNKPENSMKHLVLSEGLSRLYCASYNRITVLNPTTLTEIKTISVPGKVRAMKLVGGDLYVLVAGNPAKVLIISDSSEWVIAEIEVGMEAVDMAVTYDGSKIFVAKGVESKIDVVSTATGELINSVECGGNPRSIVLSHKDKRLYAIDGSTSEVIVINALANKVIKRIAVGENCVRLRSAGNYIYAVDKSATSKAVYVIETSSNKLIGTIQLDDVPYDVAPHPNGDYAIIVCRGGNKIYKVEGLEVVGKKTLLQPQSALVTDVTLGTAGIIYSKGSEIIREDPSKSSSLMTASSVVTASAGGMRIIEPDQDSIEYGDMYIVWDPGDYFLEKAHIFLSIDNGSNYDHQLTPDGGVDAIEGGYIWDSTLLSGHYYDNSCKLLLIIEAASDDSGPFTIDNRTIQEKINDAPTLTEPLPDPPYWPVVEIFPGTYNLTSDLIINKNIILKSSSGDPADTIIDIGKRRIDIIDPTVYPLGTRQPYQYKNSTSDSIDYVIIEGFTMRGCYSSRYTYKKQSAYGLYTISLINGRCPINNYAETLIIKDCIISDNKGRKASAFYSWGGPWDDPHHVTLENTQVINNVSEYQPYESWYPSCIYMGNNGILDPWEPLGTIIPDMGEPNENINANTPGSRLYRQYRKIRERP